MTLQDFFEACAQQPAIPIFYFIALPLTALLAGIFGKAEGHLSPWKYLYSVLIYLAAIPGIFSITLSIYLFLFERRSIFETDIILQVLPVVVMLLTFWLIRRNVEMDRIPGFGQLGGLILMIFVLMAGMWILDRTHVFVISILPFQWFVILFIGLLIAFRFGWKQIFEKPKSVE